ncbi:MAG: AAA family ATPase [Corynebacterium sp.]|uniref:AAA family ATPase n=1 Tax=Corynebacterium sp. TaxID=1720 RepID=UPI0026E0D46A|nr:AAA family ATPase [Corynebacterium sp.]MDO5670371.1 AAA family ATPase [Corynebacterium sp.]
MQPSPYTPGTVATDVPGRQTLLQDVDRRLEFIRQFPRIDGRISVYVGPRGVGKTSFLRAAQKQADIAGYATLWVTAGDGSFVDSLVAEFHGLTQSWRGDAKAVFLGLLSSLSVSAGGVSVTFEGQAGERAQKASLGRALQSVVEAATRQVVESGHHGLVIFVDEIQAADDDGLRALAYAWQHMQSEAADLPVMALTAGLGHSQDVITEAVSFAERFKYEHLGNLDEDAARSALADAAEDAGVSWAPAALAEAMDLATGYPYFLQLVGDFTWQAAGYPATGAVLELPHVAQARRDFAESREDFFRSRWMKATDAESEVLQAMAQLPPGPKRRGDIAAALAKPTTAISMVRRSLLDKGLVEASGWGMLDFTAPGFAEFLKTELGLD